MLNHSQNFIRSGALVDRLLDASSLQPGDLVLDLGAGTGAITEKLALRGCQTIAIEKDAALVHDLSQRLRNIPSVRIKHCDIFELTLPRRAYKVFSNIPFNATAGIVGRLTSAARPPEDAYIVMQSEAAERFIGHPRTTLQSALLFPRFEITRLHHFQRTDFVPAPRVEVVMLRLRKRGPPLVSAANAQAYRDFVVRLFTGTRSSLTDSLGTLLGKARGDRLARSLSLGCASPAQLPARDWVELFNTVHRLAGNDLKWKVAHAEHHLRRQQGKLQKQHRTRPRVDSLRR
jgi:23S rRNA (adenine-N6)-dimethyltransferase